MSDIFDVDNPGEERVDLAPEIPDGDSAVFRPLPPSMTPPILNANVYPTAAEEAAFIASTLGEQGEDEVGKVLSALDLQDNDDDDEPYPQGPAEDIVAESERIWIAYGEAFRKYKDALTAEFEAVNAYTLARQKAYDDGQLTALGKDGVQKLIGSNETERELHERHVLGDVVTSLDRAKQARRLAEAELEYWKEGTRQVDVTIRLNELLLR